MKLNNTSYVHVTIRKLCYQLELLSGMKLVTDLSEEFEQLQFIDKYGYIIIDYKKEACFALSHHLTQKEMDTINDINLYLDWLELGNKIASGKSCNKNVIIPKKQQRVRKKKKD